MNKNLAIIGASYLQLPLIEKAKDMGYITHVFAWAANDVGENVADYFYPISIVEKDKILEKCRELNICGICSIASDLAMLTVNYVANRLGLVGNSMISTEISTNKFKMRQVFLRNGDPSPKCFLVDEKTDLGSLDFQLPVIVKPTDRSGSRGVSKIDDLLELELALDIAIQESFEKKALVEEYVDGEEFSVEYISYLGKHNFLALTKKFTTGEPHFIETAHLQPAKISDAMVCKIKSVIEHALDSLGITNGASHSEIKIDNEGSIKIIEIGGRMGGDCIGSDLVELSTGIDFVKAVIDVACGNEPNLEKCGQQQSVKSVFIFTKDDLEEFRKIQESEPEKLVRIAHLDESVIGKTTDSSNRAGCYILKI